MLERIAQARRLLREAIEGANSPMIERSLTLADMNLHWAQWNLGVPATLLHEGEEGD